MAMLSPSDLLHTDSLLDHGSNHKTDELLRLLFGEA